MKRRFYKGFGLFSLGALYQFQRKSKVVPLVNGGYPLAFRSEALNMIYFRGRVNFWPQKHQGLRIDFLDQVPLPDDKDNLLQFRICPQIR